MFTIEQPNDLTDKYNWHSLQIAMNQYGGTMEDAMRIMDQERECFDQGPKPQSWLLVEQAL